MTVFYAKGPAGVGRVETWRGDVRLSMSVSAPFVWRCLSPVGFVEVQDAVSLGVRLLAAQKDPGDGWQARPSPASGALKIAANLSRCAARHSAARLNEVTQQRQAEGGRHGLVGSQEARIRSVDA